MEEITLGQASSKGGKVEVTKSVTVSQSELGTNCWLPSRFLGGGCDAWHDCHYPEKQTCKAEPSRPPSKPIKRQRNPEKEAERNRIVECDACGGKARVKNMNSFEVYDHPFDDVSRTIYFHKKMPRAFQKAYHYEWRESCDELMSDHSWSDFRWFNCGDCNRIICEQNPSNGWHSQYRDVDGEQICLRCYEKKILENGISRESFENGQLEGMFLSGDNHEAYDAGYQLDERVDDKRVAGSSDAKEVCKIALEHIDAGRKVIIGYERMAIGGLEGYVSLFYKD